MRNPLLFLATFAALACAAAPIDRAFLNDLVAIPSESEKPERVNEAMAFTRAYLEKRGVPCVMERDGPREAVDEPQQSVLVRSLRRLRLENFGRVARRRRERKNEEIMVI